MTYALANYRQNDYTIIQVVINLDFDAVTAGVLPGGLVSSTEVKVLICYVLDSVGVPVSATGLCELLNFEGIANIFEVSDNIEALSKSGHIICTDDLGDNYTVTSSGSEIARTLKTTVPLTVRDKACRATLNMLAKIRNTNETDIAITREGDNTFITCSALDNDKTIMSVKLLVTDENQAMSIKNKFIENPSDIYSQIIDLFTK